MRDLVYTAFASLDGVVDSPGGGPGEEHRAGGWVFKDIEFNPDVYALKVEELEDTTALMFGRRSYESFCHDLASLGGPCRLQGAAQVRRLQHDGRGRPRRWLGSNGDPALD